MRLGYRSIIGVVFFAVFFPATAQPAAAKSQTVVVPFDFSRHAIVVEVTVHGVPLHMFLDTGVSPSVIDTARAKELGLKIDFADGGEGSGSGNDQHVMAYPTSIDQLAIRGRPFGSIQALTADQSAISRAYGRRIDGTLGLSFLSGKVILINYAAATLTISDGMSDVAPQLAGCGKAWRMPLRSFPGDTIPVVEMRIGNARLPVSIDTGSNGTLELYQDALDRPGVKAALVETGTQQETGARGGYVANTYVLNTPIRLGPFQLAAGESVTLRDFPGSSHTRLANVGDKLLSDMRVQLLLDYRDNRIGFYGGCAER
ncbi:MAG: retropepsin-like domain-containing protein [Gammaproteobacteria bacterium]|nr:retropepsin-like domain-containing protein [Gammaproteobacteria bacterium]